MTWTKRTPEEREEHDRQQREQADAEFWQRIERETRPEAEKVRQQLGQAIRRLKRMKDGPQKSDLITWARHLLEEENGG